MVLTLNTFVGFETGGLEESSAVTGSPDATEATIVRSGIRALKLPHSGQHIFDIQPFSSVADAGTGYVAGFAFQTNDTTPNSGHALFRAEDTGVMFSLVWESDGDFSLTDNTGGTIGTATTPFTNNVWHYIEVYFQHSATASIEVFIDGTSVIGPATNQDLLGSGTFDTIRFFQQAANTTSDAYIDDVYLLSGATAASDRLGDAEVFGYQTGHATATDLGATLASGEWNDTADTPAFQEFDASAASLAGAVSSIARTDMNDANARGQGPGPNGDSNIDGDSNIKGAKYIFNLKRSNGSGTSMGYLYGNSGDGSTSSGNIESQLGTSYTRFEEVSEAAGVVPLSSEYLQIGLEAGTTDTGGREIFCSEAWAMLLHVPTPFAPTKLSDVVFADQNYFQPPFDI